MNMKLTVALLLSLSLPMGAATFNVRDFGATGDGHTLDTAAIQKAVDAASVAGGGTVLVPAGQYLTDPFTLASGIDLHLDANAVILIDNDLTRYPVDRKRYVDAITATGAHDLGISGDGAIDGQGEVWWQAFRDNPNMTHRPYMIKFLKCTRLKITGVTLRNSPMFHLVTQNCTDVTISASRSNPRNTRPTPTALIRPAGISSSPAATSTRATMISPSNPRPGADARPATNIS